MLIDNKQSLCLGNDCINKGRVMKNKNPFVNAIILLFGIICASPIIAITFFNVTHPSIDDKYAGTNIIHNNPNPSLGKNFKISIDSLMLPKLRGYGDLYSWQVAMTLDPTLLKMAQEMTLVESKNIYLINDKFEKFLFRWARVEDATIADVYKSISPNVLFAPSKIEFMLDARKIAFMQKITGTDFINANKASITGAKEAWNMFFNDFLNKFLLQGPLHSIFTQSYYDFRDDTLRISSALDEVIANTQHFAISMDSDSSVSYIRYVQNIIKLNKDAFNDPDFDKKIDAMLPPNQ